MLFTVLTSYLLYHENMVDESSSEPGIQTQVPGENCFTEASEISSLSAEGNFREKVTQSNESKGTEETNYNFK